MKREQLEAILLASAPSFKLGGEWPDWWAERHIANDAITFNADGRWRGGPDYALIKTASGWVRIEHGGTISRDMFA